MSFITCYIYTYSFDKTVWCQKSKAKRIKKRNICNGTLAFLSNMYIIHILIWNSDIYIYIYISSSMIIDWCISLSITFASFGHQEHCYNEERMHFTHNISVNVGIIQCRDCPINSKFSIQINSLNCKRNVILVKIKINFSLEINK